MTSSDAARAPESIAETPLTTRWLVRPMLALLAFGIAADVVIVVALGGGGSASTAASLVLGAPLAVAAGWHLVTDGSVRPAPAAVKALALYVAWCALSVFWGNTQGGVEVNTRTCLQLLVLVWLAWQLIRTEDDVAALLWGYVAGCTLDVLLTWRAFQARQFITYGRYAPAHFDPNDLCVYLALGIPMAVFLGIRGKGVLRFLAFLYLPLAMSGVALSGSWTGLAAASVALVGVALWLARRSQLGLVLTVALLAAGITYSAANVPADTWSRLFTFQEEFEPGASMGGRRDLWLAGIELFAENPVAGVGSGGFERAVIPKLRYGLVAHSTPLSIAVELGLVGLLLFYGAFALAVRDAHRGTGPHRRMLGWVLVLTWATASLALTWELRKTTWLIALLAAALGAVRSKDESEA